MFAAILRASSLVSSSAADRRLKIASNKQAKLGRTIAATRASTIVGMKANARCVAMEFRDGKIEDILDDFHSGIAVSIMRDLTALAA
ncbi:MAG: hypothetical protein WB689_00155 [Xanthobacteraceae bacterium]